MLKPHYLFCCLLTLTVAAECFAQKIYWTDRGTGQVKAANLSPTGISGTYTVASFGNVGFVTLDPAQGFVYFSDEPSIQRADINDGSGVTEIINKFVMSGYSDIAYSENASALFATGIGGDEGAYTVSESGVETQFSLPGGGYRGVVGDNGNEMVYYASTSNDIVYQTNFSGGSTSAIVSVPGAEYLGFDERTRILYISGFQSSTYRIYSYNVNTTAFSQLVSLDANRIVSIQPYSQFGKVYYVKEGVGVYSMNLDGTGSTLLISGSQIGDIAILADVTPPVFNALNPADNASTTPISNNLILTFDENVKVSTTAGVSNETSFRLYKTTGNVLVETFSRSAANVTISNNIVTLNPTAALEYNTNYYVLAGSKVISDLSGNDWVGITLTTGWNFTSEVDTNIFYSRQSGNWDDVNTWSHVSHTGPVATASAGGTGHQAFIGGSDVVTLTGETFMWDLTIESGSTLNAANFAMDLNGVLNIDGVFQNGGELKSTMGFDLHSSTGIPVFKSMTLGSGFSGAVFELFTDVVTLEGYTISTGSLQNNGHTVYEPPTNISFTTGVTPSDTNIKLDWTRGNGSKVLVVMRLEGPPEVKPVFTQTYTANSVFGSGGITGPDNFVVYNGTGTTVTVTGLAPSTQYYFSLYEYYDNIPTYGTLYNVTNYQVTPAATCATLTAPVNPLSAEYCNGSPAPTISVGDPGSGKDILWYEQTGTTAAVGTPSGAGNSTFAPSAPGSYAAKTRETATGCVSSALTLVTLTQHPTLVPGTAAANQTVCAGGDPAIITGGTATGGNGTYSYQWESASAIGGPYTPIPGAMSTSYDPPAGIVATIFYRRSVQAFCSQTGNIITVTVTPLPVITAHPQNQIACDTKNASFAASATGASLTYQWQVNTGSGFTNISNGGVYSGALTNALSISNVTGLNNAQYRVNVMTSGACPVISNAATLTVNTNPVANNQPQTLCENTAGSGSATVNLTSLNNGVTGGAASRSVNWFTDAAFTNAVATPASASATNGATFYAQVTNTVTSCTNSSTAVITVNSKPSVSTSPKTICSGTATAITFTSTPAGATYVWTITANANITGAANGSGSGINQTLSNTSSSQQTITYNVTPTLNTCAGSVFTQSVSVDPVPTTFTVSGGGQFCAGESGANISLSNSQIGITYELFRSATATAIVIDGTGQPVNFPPVNIPGTYTVKAKTGLGCSKDMTGSATITMLDVPSGSGTISGGLELCIGNASTYTVNNIIGADSFTWTLPAGLETDPLDVDNSINVVAKSGSGGLIKVIPQNTCGAGSPISRSMGVIPSPVVSITLPTEAFATEEVSFGYSTLSIVQSTLWEFGNGSTSSDENGTTIYPVGGTFEITLAITDATGCTGKDVKTLEVKPKAALADLAIKNVITANGDGANDFLFIENIEKFPDNEVVVMDRWGAEVFRKKGYINDWDAREGDKYLPSGNYVCVVRFNGEIFSRTVTIIKEQ
jgi:gliding motility-associated-like protein